MTEPDVHPSRRWWVIVSTALSVVLLMTVIAVAAVYWPARFGGSHTVVRVSGQSMEPTLRDADIVIVRALDEYALGDVIVYPGRDEAGEIRGYVIHRIVGGDARNGYVTRGDNRTTDDPWRPTPDDIDGTVVRTLAAGSVAGSLVSVFTQPLGLALIAAGLVFIAVWRLTAKQAASDVGAVPRRRRAAGGIPYGWVPAPSLPAPDALRAPDALPARDAMPAPQRVAPARVDLAALVRVVEESTAAATAEVLTELDAAPVTQPLPVVPIASVEPAITAPAAGPDLWTLLRTQTARLDELEVRWAEPAVTGDPAAVPVG